MDPMIWKEKLSAFFSRYKYVCIVVLVGLVLMSLPGQEDEQTQTVSEHSVPEESTITAQLESILSMIEGVGKVQVLLTVSEGEQIQYVYDEDRDQGTDSSSVRRDTVIISDAERSDQGLIEQVIPPVYLGAVVVCEGGDIPSVQLNIVKAVSNATGLSADRITVLKMK